MEAWPGKDTEISVGRMWRYTQRIVGEKTRMVSELEVATNLGWSGIVVGLWIPKDSGSAQDEPLDCRNPAY